MTSDVSNFPKLADRLQQGLLNELFLGAAMIHPDGLRSDPAFQVDGDRGTPSVIDTSRLYYDGNSQGGIIGGALTALAPDFTRAALGVPAMRYSLLLPRSVDFDQFGGAGHPNYPDELTRPLILALIQMLWDRGEPNGYAHRMTRNPLPETPAHQVLINVAFGDHQVTNFAADVEARTIGASAHVPILYPGRWPGVDVLGTCRRSGATRSTARRSSTGTSGRCAPTPRPGEPIGVPPPPLERAEPRRGGSPRRAARGAPAAQLLSRSSCRRAGRSPTSVAVSPAVPAAGRQGSPLSDRLRRLPTLTATKRRSSSSAPPGRSARRRSRSSRRSDELQVVGLSADPSWEPLRRAGARARRAGRGARRRRRGRGGTRDLERHRCSPARRGSAS